MGRPGKKGGIWVELGVIGGENSRKPVFGFRLSGEGLFLQRSQAENAKLAFLGCLFFGGDWVYWFGLVWEFFGRIVPQPQANQAQKQPENRKSHVSGCRFTWEYCFVFILQTTQRQPEKHITPLAPH